METSPDSWLFAKLWPFPVGPLLGFALKLAALNPDFCVGRQASFNRISLYRRRRETPTVYVCERAPAQGLRNESLSPPGFGRLNRLALLAAV